MPPADPEASLNHGFLKTLADACQLRRLNWREKGLKERPKEDTVKQALAERLRREAMLTIRQIAERRHLDSWQSLNRRIYLLNKAAHAAKQWNVMVRDASKRRTDDLRTEYVELKPYLESLRGAPAVASAEKLKAHMKRNIGKPEFPRHLGAGGWSKVLTQLITVGVLAKKPGDGGEDEKLSAALVYRDGLEMKSAGLK